MKESIEKIKLISPYKRSGIKMSGDDILQEVALRLEKDPKFPGSGEIQHAHLRAKIALRNFIEEIRPKV